MKRVRNKLIFSLLTAFVFFMALGALAFGGVTNVAKADGIVSEFQMLNGASVRYIAPTGIRFTSRMSADDYDTLKTNHPDAEIATLLLPTHMLGENNTLTVDNYKSLGAVKAEFTERYVVDGYATFNAVLTGLDSSFYNTDLTAVSYIKVGESVQYAAFNGETEKASVSRNIADVSAAALASGEYNNNEEAYLFLTDMVFTNYTVASNMDGTAETSKTNVGVALDTAFTKNGSAVDSRVISNVTYTVTDGGKIVENNGKQYFYAPSAGEYTVTSTATIKQGGTTTDITSNKTITVENTNYTSITFNQVGSGDNFETNLYLKFLSNETSGTYTVDIIIGEIPNRNAYRLMTITRNSKNYGVLSLIHNNGMVSGGRYAERTSNLDFGSGIYVKLIKFSSQNYQDAIISVYVSTNNRDYNLYAVGRYANGDNFFGNSLVNITFSEIGNTANTPVYVTGLTAGKTDKPSEKEISEIPKFEQFKVDFAASASSIRVGGSSNLTFTATYDDADVTASSTVNYTIKKDGEITEAATITEGVFTTNVAGTYTVTATATYAGKEKTASVEITVLDNELTATLSFTPSSVKAKVPAYASLSVIYNDEEVVSGYTVVYSIIPGNTEIARITDAGVFTADENGTYTVRAAVSYNGLNFNADRNIKVAATHTVDIDLSDTTSATRTNVGVFLYDKVTVDGDVTVEYPVSWTTSGDGRIEKTFNGESYFYATSAGTYTLTAKITVDDVDYKQTKKITVSDSTAVSTIYSNGFNPDYGHGLRTSDDNIIVGNDGYYYGARNNTVDNALFFNGGYSVSSTYALEVYIKFIGTVSQNRTLFFTMWAGNTQMGDGITLERANGATTATLTIAGAPQSGSKDFGSGLYFRILSITEGDTHKFKVYTSADKKTYTLWASANATGNYTLGFTGLCLFSQTPVVVADFNVISNAAISADMGGTASSAYTDQTVTLNTAVSFGGNSLDSGYTLAYEITSGSGSIEEGGVLRATGAGSITVQATATYNGFTTTESKVITFSEHTLAGTISLSAGSTTLNLDETTYLNPSVTFTIDGEASNAYTVEYSTTGGTLGNDETGEKFYSASAGTYTITATLKYNGDTIATDTVVIRVGSAEPVIAGTISLSAGSTTLDLGNATYLTPSVTFTIDGEASDAYTVEYSTTGGTLGNNGTGEYFYSTTANTYTITATLKYNGETIATGTVSITVNTNNRKTYGDVGNGTAVLSNYNITNGTGDFEWQFYLQFISQSDSSNKTIYITRWNSGLGGQNNGAGPDYNDIMKIYRKSGGSTGTIWFDEGNSGRKYYNANGTERAADSDGAGRELNFANGIHFKYDRKLEGNKATMYVYVSEDGGLTYTPYVKSVASAWFWWDTALTGMHIHSTTPVIVSSTFNFSTTRTKDVPS